VANGGVEPCLVGFFLGSFFFEGLKSCSERIVRELLMRELDLRPDRRPLLTVHELANGLHPSRCVMQEDWSDSPMGCARLSRFVGTSAGRASGARERPRASAPAAAGCEFASCSVRVGAQPQHG